jgi:hypothetical protein
MESCKTLLYINHEINKILWSTKLGSMILNTTENTVDVCLQMLSTQFLKDFHVLIAPYLKAHCTLREGLWLIKMGASKYFK